VQLLNPESRDHLLKTDVNYMFFTHEVKMKWLAKSCLVPGYSTFPQQPRQVTGTWLDDFKHG
jgi:hypothetical protein